MSYLEQYDQAPESHKHQLAKGWVDHEPLPFFAELRQSRPILTDPECTYVALYDDVMEVLSQPGIFTVQLYEPSMGTYMLAQDDTAIHWREKSIMQSMLNWDDLPRIRQLTAGHCQKILAASSSHSLDLVPEYTRKVPALIVQDYFGLNGCPPEDLMRWSHWNQYQSFHNQPFDLLSMMKREKIRLMFLEAGLEFKLYLGHLAKRRLAEIQQGSTADDVTARLLRTVYPTDVDFPFDRLVLNIGGLLIGTIETTAQAVAQVVRYFLRNPTILAQARTLLQAGQVADFDSCVWEALRYDPISPYLFRKTSRDYVLAKGTERETYLRAGSLVLPLTLSAMFDPRRYPDPNSFTPRPFEDYLHLGYGHHACLGKYVAKELVPEMVRNVLLLPNITAISDIDYDDTPFPVHYPVQWGGAPGH